MFRELNIRPTALWEHLSSSTAPSWAIYTLSRVVLKFFLTAQLLTLSSKKKKKKETSQNGHQVQKCMEYYNHYKSDASNLSTEKVWIFPI